MKTFIHKSLSAFLILHFSVLLTHAADAFSVENEERLEQEVNAFLHRWEQDPKTVMNEPPSRWNENDEPVPPRQPSELRFSVEAIESGAAILARDRERSQKCMSWEGKTKCLNESRAGMAGSDLPNAVADNGATLIWNLEALEKRGLRSSWLEVQPWSGDYWPTFKGAIGARYADGGFPNADWLSNYNYVQNVPAGWIYRNGADWQVDLLSPAEKYDLFTGNPRLDLTQSQWQRGQEAYQQKGYVEPWMGICHGWAAAAIMAPRPRHGVQLVAADGRRKIYFYPTDIKALASLLWADGRYESRFAGGRCRETNPAQDYNGRIVSPNCFDTNPGTWHLAVTNQIGVSRRGLILDSTYDYEIWNQPVVRYSYGYFNPQTRYYAQSLNEARVPMSRFTNDPFRRYRSPGAAAVVGIAMDVTYMIETPPNRSTTDHWQADLYRRVRYVYDLELDANGNVIGGEWYQNLHPDFLWVPTLNSRAVSEYEHVANEPWYAVNPLPPTWKTAAANASAMGLPLGRIVQALLEMSNW